MNSKERRILDRAPEKVQEIMRILPQGWAIIGHGPSSMGWQADLSFGKKEFRLVEDRFYIGVSSMKDGKMKTIVPPLDQRVTIFLDQVCALLMKGVENWGKE